ncbi:hypothetical protein [Actinomadura rudentiformis]|uniref:Uncharacterized protein n=1 Tax=Actinomadura rudentiformis TaxID=359158 RepID=A0A6H9YLK6_9ACTN|nr:hypothetical protein [Actinomadura rudentiformis]KAB2342150.1 hypothetical protein F8566_39510 [Actinomadura rudentiformis]
MTLSSKQRAMVMGAAVAVAVTTLGGGGAMAAVEDRPAAAEDRPAAAKPREAHVTGDAWVNYPGDKEYPHRRFIVDAHGAPWKIVNNKIQFGAARGTIKFNHYAPDEPGGPSKDHWGSIKVDYVMATGPIAVVSGIRQDDVPANMRRATLTFYQSPLGHKYDRMGFSWGVVDPRCLQMGTGPAPFSPVSRGPHDQRISGYTVKDAPLPVPDGEFEGPDTPADCSFKDADTAAK